MKLSLAVIMLGAAASFADAGTLSVSGTWGGGGGGSAGLSAEARFENTSRGLSITLTDRSPRTTQQSRVFSAIFFDVVSGETLTPFAATRDGTPVPFAEAGHGASAGWTYAGALTGTPGQASRGISCAGFMSLGANTSDGPTTLNHANLSISFGADVVVPNAPAPSSDPTLYSNITFILTGVSGKFDPSLRIRNVSFLYTPSLTKSNESVTSVPLPSAGMLGLAGLGAMGLRRRR